METRSEKTEIYRICFVLKGIREGNQYIKRSEEKELVLTWVMIQAHSCASNLAELA
jgi:hypothetical protein